MQQTVKHKVIYTFEHNISLPNQISPYPHKEALSAIKIPYSIALD